MLPTTTDLIRRGVLAKKRFIRLSMVTFVAASKLFAKMIPNFLSVVRVVGDPIRQTFTGQGHPLDFWSASCSNLLYQSFYQSDADKSMPGRLLFSDRCSTE